MDAIYESLGVSNKDTEHAPYRDGAIARVHRKVNELEAESRGKDTIIKELTKEVEELKKELNRSGGGTNGDNKGSRDHSETFEATFYTAFCPTGCSGITATGIDVSNTVNHEGKRIIAVDPSVIPLGSIVRVTLKDGTSFEATAQDTGGAIKGNRIDVLVASRDEAYKLGRQSAKVEIIN